MNNIVDFGKTYPDRQFNGERLKIARLWRDISANEMADKGRIFVNEKQVKPSYEVKIGDIIEIKFGEKISKFKIIEIPKVQGKNMPEMIELL